MSPARTISIHVAALSLVAFAAASANAEYVLQKGHGIEVCEAYLKNLNSFDPKGPMQCERPVNESFTDLSKPTWERLYVGADESRLLLKELNDYMWKRDVNPAIYMADIDGWRRTPDQLSAAYQNYLHSQMRRDVIGYLVGKVDIDNDGKLDHVMLDRACTGGFGSLPFVLNDAGTAINKRKTERILQHPSRRKSGLPDTRPLQDPRMARPGAMKREIVSDAVHGLNYDIFMFKGQTYIDTWWRFNPNRSPFQSSVATSTLDVYTIEKGASKKVCSLTFKFR